MRLKNKIVLVTASTRGIGLACVKACAAINYLTKLIAVQEASNHIRCNAVLPGMTATEAVEKNLSDDFRNLFLRHIPLKKSDFRRRLPPLSYILPVMNPHTPPVRFLQSQVVLDSPHRFMEIYRIR